MPPYQASTVGEAARKPAEALTASLPGGGTRDQGALNAAYTAAIRLLLRRTAEGLLTRSPAAPQSPHTVLTDLYEHLLRYSPHYDPTSGRVRLIRDHRRRKAAGSFYTPSSVARQVVEESLHAIGDAPMPSVLDPAAGTGVFLLEAARCIASRHGVPLAQVAERCLFGVELDPLAREIAILSLWLETGARPHVVAGHVACADALTTPLAGRFDLVVGNPPWGVAYSRERRAQLKRRFPRATRGAFDSFKLFIELEARLTRGALGMVVPQAVLAQEKHADAREVLLETLDPYFVADLGDSFSGVAAPAAAIVFGRKPGPPSVRTLSRSQSSGSIRSVPAGAFASQGGFPTAHRTALQVLRRLEATLPALGEEDSPFAIRDVGINYNRASIATKIFYADDEPTHPDDMPRFRGRDFDRYTAVGRSGWLRHDPQRLLEGGEALSLNLATYGLAEKIVFRQTADRIVATLDRSRSAMGRSVIAITAEGPVSLRALLACLNSQLFTALYRARAGEEGRTLPQVKVGRMAALPLPEVALHPIPVRASRYAQAIVGASDAGATLHASHDPWIVWACLQYLADRLLAAQGRDPRALALVDKFVADLYGLREQERTSLGLTL